MIIVHKRDGNKVMFNESDLSAATFNKSNDTGSQVEVVTGSGSTFAFNEKDTDIDRLWSALQKRIAGDVTIIGGHQRNPIIRPGG